MITGCLPQCIGLSDHWLLTLVCWISLCRLSAQWLPTSVCRIIWSMVAYLSMLDYLITGCLPQCAVGSSDHWLLTSVCWMLTLVCWISLCRLSAQWLPTSVCRIIWSMVAYLSMLDYLITGCLPQCAVGSSDHWLLTSVCWMLTLVCWISLCRLSAQWLPTSVCRIIWSMVAYLSMLDYLITGCLPQCAVGSSDHWLLTSVCWMLTLVCWIIWPRDAYLNVLDYLTIRCQPQCAGLSDHWLPTSVCCWIIWPLDAYLSMFDYLTLGC